MTLPELLVKYDIREPICASFISPGWLPLVEGLIKQLIALGWDRDLHQVKQKFGGLRFYIGTGTPAIHQAIGEAEKLSWAICEECGVDSARCVSEHRWITTLCRTCETKP